MTQGYRCFIAPKLSKNQKASDILCNPETEMQCIDSQENDVADDLQRKKCICQNMILIAIIENIHFIGR